MNKSVSRAVDILAYLSHCQNSAGISEISRALDIPKSSASDCLYTLVEKGYVRFGDEHKKTFAIGVNAARLGLAVLDKVGIGRLTEGELNSFFRRTGFSAGFFLLSENGVFCAVTAAKNILNFKPVVSVNAGDVFELHLTAAGKAILSLLSEKEVEELVGTGCYSAHTPSSICNYSALTRELELIRMRGYAVENFENNSFTWSIAVPLTYRGGRPAALSVGMSAAEHERCDVGLLAAELIASAERISKILNMQ